jgi:hypothetical protein
MISLVDAPHLEILSKRAMTCAKLKQFAQGMTRHGTHEWFQWIGVLSSIQLPLSGGEVLAKFTLRFVV